MKPSRLLLGVVGCVALLAVAPALAVPRYGARYGQRCALCHVDPAGGGMRTLYASQMIVPEELSWTRPQAADAIRPDLTPAVTVGLDLRNLLLMAEGGRADQVDMQANVHLGVEMTPRLTAVVTTGDGTQEYAAIAYVLPLDGYVKFGRFTPDFGWRWDDHFMASRRYLLSPGGNPDPGYLRRTAVEVGAHTQWLEATAALLDDEDQQRESFSGRAVLRRSWGGANVALGSSIVRLERGTQQVHAWAGFGYVAAGPVSWVFELDQTGVAEGVVREGRLLSQELAVRLRRGLSLRLAHSFHDPDRHLKTGADSRWGAGFDLLATPFFGAMGMLNRYETDPGPDRWQGELVLHVLY